MNTHIKYTFVTINNLNMKITNILILKLLFSMLTMHTVYAQDGTVKVEQPSEIDALLQYKKDVKKTISVYKIQIFQSNDSFKAQRAKADFLNTFGEWPVSLEFNTPNYKIWVGNFRDRLEADRALKRIKKKYMNAFIFQPKED